MRSYEDGNELRYGENHIKSLVYVDKDCPDAGIAQTDILHGKPMSYNNYVDGEGALEAVKELAGTPGVEL